MRRDKWMHVNDFNELYDVNKNHVSVVNSISHPHWIRHRDLSHRKVHTIDVNIGFLLRVEERRLQLTEEAHDLFYEGIEMFGSPWALSRVMSQRSKSSQASWNDWLANRLFRSRNESFTILNTKINKRMIKFVREMRQIKRKIDD